LDWSSFGSGFFATWCDSCHGGALRGGVRVEGDLTLVGAAASSVAVPGLCEVTGALVLQGGGGELSFPDLQRAGALRVEAASAPWTLGLGALTEVGGDLTLGPDGPSGRLDLGALATVEGDLTVEGSPGLEALTLWRLERVGGELRLEQLEGLTDLIGLDDLGQVGGPIRLAALPRLARWRGLGALEGFDLALVDLASLQSLQVGLWSEAAGDLRLEGLPALTEATVAPLAARLGDLVLVDLPALSALDGGWRAEEAGDLRVVRAGLRALGPLSGLRSLRGDLELRETELGSLSALLQLERVEGGLTLQANPRLPDGAQAELREAIDVIGGPILLDRD
jgi:hypothetical protein